MSLVIDRRTRAARISERADLIGLVAMFLLGLGVVAIGAGWLEGDAARILIIVLFVAVVALIVGALIGGAEARRKLAPYGLLKPGVLWLSLFFLAPIWSLFVMSLSAKTSRFDFFPDFSWHWENYKVALTDFRPQFIRSFSYAGAATVLTMAIGFPLAYVIAFRGGRYKNILIGLVIVPFFTSYLIRTLAWQNLLADSGPIVSIIERLHLTGVLESLNIMDQGRLMNTPAAVIGGLTYNFLPFMVLPINQSKEKIDARLLDAASDLYSTSGRAFRKVVVPLTLPGVFAGTLLTFIPAAGDFINAALLGSPNTTMIGNSIQDQFIKQNNWPVAGAMSLVLMAIISCAVLVYTRFLGTEDLI